MKTFNKALSLLLSLVMVMSFCAGFAFADNEVAPGDQITVDFPDIYPTEALEDITDFEIDYKVEAILKAMTEEEMYMMLGGSRTALSPIYTTGTGFLIGVPRLGVPVLRMWDGPKGTIVDGFLETTAPVSELGLGASWDPEMAYAYGEMVAKEDIASFSNVQLGTQMDISRDVSTGRSRDTLSEDPYLTQMIGDPFAASHEDNHVIAVLKHYGCYSSYNQNQNCIIDEQTMQEVWLQPFEYVLKRGNASSVMSSYSTINGEYASANHYLEITVLRDMWGFKGCSMTDWGGNHENTVGLGTDLEMGSLNRNGRQSTEALIAAGTRTYEDVITCVRHTLYAYGATGYLGLVQVNQSGFAVADEDPPAAIELPMLDQGTPERLALLAESNQVAYESAAEGAVLLKNDGVLPLSANDSVAVIGIGAERTIQGHYSESAFGTLAPWSGLYYELVANGINATKAVGTNNIFGNDIPADWLFTDAACTTNGVTVTKTSGEGDSATSSSYTKSSLELVTNSVDYKNAEDGDATVLGESAAVKTYLKVPESGTYGLKLSSIGLSARTATIGEVGAEESTSFATRISSGRNNPVGGFGKTSVVVTKEGLDIPGSFTNVELEAGKVYEINIEIATATKYKDGQFRVTYETEGTRAADAQAVVDAAANNNKVIFMGYATGTTNTGLANNQQAMLDTVIETAKANGNKVIVVLETATPFVFSFKDQVDAIVEMWLPGQAGARAEADLLTGVKNFSGRLPIAIPATVESSQERTPDWNKYELEDKGYHEGIFVGYKYYDKYDIETMYDFGFGLSYTTFAYSGLSIKKDPKAVAYDVSFKVKNTGSVAGDETAQVYLGEAQVPEGVQMAKYALAGFAKVKDLQPGEERDVTVRVEERQLSYWYTDMEVENDSDYKWVVAEGERTFYVGSSSDNLILSQVVNVTAEKQTAAADVVVDNVVAEPGESVDIDVCIENSQGVAGYLLYIETDSEYVSITGVIEGTAEFDGRYTTQKTDNGYKVLWSSAYGIVGDGILFSVRANVAADAPNGVYPITVSYSDVNTVDENSQMVEINTIDGSITVAEVIPGDLNGDGEVTNADIVMLARYLVNLVTFTPEQLKAADFDGNGIIGNADVVAMARYVIDQY